MADFAKLYDAVVEGDAPATLELTKQALAEGISPEELVAKFKQWMQDDNLRNSAANCCNLVLARRPDLAE